MTIYASALNSPSSSPANCSGMVELSESEAARVSGGWIVPVGGFLLSLAGRLSARSLGATVMNQFSLGLSTFGLATYLGGDTPPSNPRSRD
jgi:hypothetical protein